MFFLHPTYLWGFLGLLIPIIIHLWSKREGKVIKVGVRSVIDGIDITTSVRLLMEDFPEIDLEYQPKDSENIIPDYWQLAQQMDQIQSDSIVVFTSAYVKGLKGKRPIVHKKINWVLLDQVQENKHMLHAIETTKGKEAFLMYSNPNQVSFTREVISSKNSKLKLNTTNDSVVFKNNGIHQLLSIKKQKEVKVYIYFEEDRLAEMKYFKAAFQSIAKHLGMLINVQSFSEDTELAKEADVVVWLRKNSVLKTNATLIVYKPEYFANNILEQSVRDGVFYLTKPLTTEIVLEQHFVEKLILILDPHKQQKQKVEAYDTRVAQLANFLPLVEEESHDLKTTKTFPISDKLWWMFVVLLCVERLLAKYRHQ